MPSRRRPLLIAAVAVLVASVVAVLVVGEDDRDSAAAVRAVDRSTTSVTRPATTSTATTSSPTTTSSTTTTTAPPPVVTEPPPTPPPPTGFTLDPYRGLGAWVDVFDWTAGYDRTPDDPPAVGLAEIDRMASLGVRTLFFQPARWDSPVPGILEAPTARAIVDRAHERGMAVVGWYLPTMVDPAADRAQIDAVLDLPLDGFALDIESTALPDEAERNARVVQLAADLRAAHPGEVLSAIVLPPVVTRVYGTYWGSFPYADLAPYFDVWQTMGYWTMRSTASGWRDAYTYTATNIDLLREATGRPEAVVHPVGGVGCCEGPTAPTTAADIDGMLRAAAERGALGASLYDYVTTGADLWPALQGANALS